MESSSGYIGRIHIQAILIKISYSPAMWQTDIILYNLKNTFFIIIINTVSPTDTAESKIEDGNLNQTLIFHLVRLVSLN